MLQCCSIKSTQTQYDKEIEGITMKLNKILLNGLLITMMLVTSIVHADSFFSKLFGGSSSEVDLKTMLSHVPADTSYLFANAKPIPSKVMDFHIKRGQEMFATILKLAKSRSKKEDDDGSSAFFDAITSEMSEKLENGKFEETGLSLKATFVFYGYKDIPVMRMSIADKDKLMELLKRAEDESDYKMKIDKCGEFECFIGSREKKGSDFALIIFKKELAFSVYSKENKKDIIDHLIGKADPKDSYTEEKWNSFLKENEYAGFGDGFVSIKKLYDANRAGIIKAFFAIKKRPTPKLSDEQEKACTLVVDDHINNIPEIIFGTKSLEEKKMDYEVVLKTSTGVSDVLQGLANETNISKRSADPIIDMGLNLNFKKASEAITAYSTFLIDSAEKNKCESIKPTDIRKSMGGMMLAMNMGLSQFKSLYFSLDEVKMNDKMKPEKFDAVISVGSDNPASLIAMLGMLEPSLADLKVPEDGTPIEFTDALPTKRLSLPPLFVSRTKESINIMIGNDKPELVDYKSEVPELLLSAVDGKRYYGLITNIMKSMAPLRKDEGMSNLTAMMETMGDIMGKVKQEYSADKRGLVINYHIQY